MPAQEAHADAYTVTTDPARVDAVQIHAMLRTAYWSEFIRFDVVERALKNSLVVVAIDNATGKTVAVARLVTDYATFAWLCDVFVMPEHRGKGLSKRMLTVLESDERLKTLRRWCLATRDAHGLYEQFGYRGVDAKAWMEKKPPAGNWREAE